MSTILKSRYDTCIEACRECVAACEANLIAMLEKTPSDNDCPACCRECADFCRLAENEMIREGRFMAKLCQLCAEVCDYCAEQCQAHEHDHCQRCAEACRRCAEECRRI